MYQIHLLDAKGATHVIFHDPFSQPDDLRTLGSPASLPTPTRLRLSGVASNATGIYHPHHPLDHAIHPDDTIHAIKLKLIESLRTYYPEDQVVPPVEAVYLFTRSMVYLDFAKEMPEDRFDALVDNLGGNSEQFVQWVQDAQDMEVPMLVTLGQKTRDPPESYYRYVNPISSISSGDSGTTPIPPVPLDAQTLLHTPRIVDGILYACLADDVFQDVGRLPRNVDTVVQQYFPYLYAAGVRSPMDYADQREALVQRTLAKLDAAQFRYHLLDQVYQATSTDDTPALGTRGVLQGTLYLKNHIRLSLDAIFKNVHATESLPAIMYNPGRNKESIIRLYSTQMAKNGRRIPALPLRKIQEIRDTLRVGTLVLYLGAPTAQPAPQELFVKMDATGTVYVTTPLTENPVPYDEWERQVRQRLTPLLGVLNGFLQKSGYMIPTHRPFQFKQIDTVMRVPAKRGFSFLETVPCLTEVFDVYRDDLLVDGPLLLKFKRVDQFRDLDGQYMLIRDSGVKREEMVQLLQANYRLSRDVALERIRTFTADPPALPTTLGIPIIFKMTTQQRLEIEIQQFPRVEFMEVVYRYLDVVLRAAYPAGAPLKPEFLTMCKTVAVQKENDVPVIPVPPPIEELPIPDAPDGKEDLPDEFLDREDEGEDEGEDQDDEDQEDEDEGFLFGGAPRKPKGNDAKKYSRIERLKHRDPKLFLTTKVDQYEAYSRICQAKRQPVVLSQEEKEELDRTHPGMHAISYGSDASDAHTQNWYVCPPFWCAKTNDVLTQAQVDAGVCKGHVETSDKYHVPSFEESSKHPKNFCLPCCFTGKWDKPMHVERRGECRGANAVPDANAGVGENANAVSPIDAEANAARDSEFVFNPMKNPPLPHHRAAFLPFAVQYLLQDRATQGSYLVPNQPTLLLYGMEAAPPGQSFLSVFADLYAHRHGMPKTPPLAEFRRILATKITLDRFVQYHRGSLVSTFHNRGDHVEDVEDIDVTPYESSQFYQSINPRDPTQLDFLEETIRAHRNFLAYLGDPGTPIDHTYLWDAVVDPILMNGGCNLILVEITGKNITDDIEMVCPSAASSSASRYDPTKETFLVLKRDSFYEPIYRITKPSAPPGAPWQVVKGFQESDPDLAKNVLYAMKLIQRVQETRCVARPSLPDVYTFQRNHSAEDLIHLLRTTTPYEPRAQVLNYQGKVIGIYVIQPNILPRPREGMVPCFPSAIVSDPDLSVRSMDDVTLWKPYAETLALLRDLKRQSPDTMLSEPRFRVVDREPSGGVPLIVGLLTETDQFVQVLPPVALDRYADDDLPTLDRGNYLVADRTVTTAKTVDVERETVIRNISLETQFYQVFRSLVRIVLNQPAHRAQRAAVIRWIEDADASHETKIVQIRRILQPLLADRVQFHQFTPAQLARFDQVTGCSEGGSDTPYCLTASGDSHPILLLPRTHLQEPGVQNKEWYWVRVADELVRYQRIRVFMLDTGNYLSIQSQGMIEYQLYPTEILALDSLLNDDYFKNLVPFNVSRYIHQTNYDNADPVMRHPVLPARVSLEEQQQLIQRVPAAFREQGMATTCIQSTRDVVGNDRSIWKRAFPKTTQEIFFRTVPATCRFHVLLTIDRMHANSTNVRASGISDTETVLRLKQELWRGYHARMTQDAHFGPMIVHYLKSKDDLKLLKNLVDPERLQDMILQDDYVLGDLDIWVWASYRRIPVVLFSSTRMNLIIGPPAVKWLYLNVDDNGTPRDVETPLYFVRSPAVYDKQRTDAPYSVIAQAFSYQDLKGEFHQEMRTALADPTHLSMMSLNTWLKTQQLVRVAAR